MTGAFTTVATTIHKPRDWFFHWFLAIDLSKIMHRYALIPSVIGVRDQTGPMHKAGASRLIEFSDGTTALEQVISCDPPREIVYRVSELTSMFRLLVREGRAQITFNESPPGRTLVEWRYAYFGRSSAANLLLRGLVPTVWRGYIGSALLRARKLAEAENSNRGPWSVAA